jgi:hypothetical protein
VSWLIGFKMNLEGMAGSFRNLLWNEYGLWRGCDLGRKLTQKLDVFTESSKLAIGN